MARYLAGISRHEESKMIITPMLQKATASFPKLPVKSNVGSSTTRVFLAMLLLNPNLLEGLN